MGNKFFEYVNYIGLILTVGGQIVIGSNFWLGQILFLLANILYTVRCFQIKQPKSDKLKNMSFIGVTLLAMAIQIL